MNFDAVKSVLAALEREEVQYVVFGAVAINLLGLQSPSNLCEGLWSRS